MYYNNVNTAVDEKLNAEIRRCISYDPERGLLTWKEKYSKHSPIVVGKAVGSPNKSGLHFTFCGRDLLCHRVAWFLHYGEWPSTFLDHINGCPEDNRVQNLRLADRRQNGANRSSSKGSSSKYLGVCYAKHTRKWQASIGTPRKYLGQYSDEKEAARVYNKAAKELYGEYARLNNV